MVTISKQQPDPMQTLSREGQVLQYNQSNNSHQVASQRTRNTALGSSRIKTTLQAEPLKYVGRRDGQGLQINSPTAQYLKFGSNYLPFGTGGALVGTPMHTGLMSDENVLNLGSVYPNTPMSMK